MKDKKIGITMGDPNGVGPEVILRFIRSEISKDIDYVIIGERSCLDYYNELYFSGRVKIDDNKFIQIDNIRFKVRPGKIDKIAGKIAFCTLVKSYELLKGGEIDAIINCPVCKESINQSGVKFTGHTEYYQNKSGTEYVVMAFLSDIMNIALLTRHIPLHLVSKRISEEDIIKAVELLDEFLKRYKGNRRYCILGLNPHSGEGGRIGNEENRIIIPAIKKLKKKYKIEGPVSPDTAFIEKNRRSYDFFICMYHDQGLIPLKTLDFINQCQITIGLPFLRLSVSHGTGFDIAGKGGGANPGSLFYAIKKTREFFTTY